MKDKLEELNACSNAIDWIADKSLEQAWNECERGDWLLWYSYRMMNEGKITLKQLIKAKVGCANLVRHLMKDERSINALGVLERFANGEATRDELNTAASAAYAASAADYDSAAYAAAYAAYDAAAAAAASAAADYAADAAAASAAYAAAASASAAAYDASDAVRKQTLKKCAEIVREIITYEMIK